MFQNIGIPERIDYAPGTGREDLLPDASLELCEIPCTVSKVLTRISLATSHIGKGCDRDTYSVQSQRKLCGELEKKKRNFREKERERKGIK